jgi:hypothetical protein
VLTRTWGTGIGAPYEPNPSVPVNPVGRMVAAASLQRRKPQ